MNVCFLIYRLSTGGLTSSLFPLVRKLTQQGIGVDLMVFNENRNFDINIPEVNIIYNPEVRTPPSFINNLFSLALMPKLAFQHLYFVLIGDKKNQGKSMVRFIQKTRKKAVEKYENICDLTKYDCVISWEEGFTNYYLAEKVLAKRKIGYMHPDYRNAGFDKTIDEIPYSKLDAIALVSKSTLDSFCAALPLLSEKAYAVPNIIDVDKIKKSSLENTSVFKKSDFDIVTVCRLDNISKALDRALHIAKRMKDDKLIFCWYFVGDGHSKPLMEKLIDKYNLQDCVFLVGEKSNPHPYTKEADLFVLQSYYEGKPLCVDEALIIGTPVLVSNYTSAHEQVCDGEHGLIADNDEDSIYEKVKYLIQNKQILLEMRESISKIDLGKYEDVTPFLDIIKKK